MSQTTRVTIIKDGLTLAGKRIAEGTPLDVNAERKAWLLQRGFIADDSTTDTSTTTSSSSKKSSTTTATSTTTEEAK